MIAMLALLFPESLSLYSPEEAESALLLDVGCEPLEAFVEAAAATAEEEEEADEAEAGVTPYSLRNTCALGGPGGSSMTVTILVLSALS